MYWSSTERLYYVDWYSIKLYKYCNRVLELADKNELADCITKNITVTTHSCLTRTETKRALRYSIWTNLKLSMWFLYVSIVFHCSIVIVNRCCCDDHCSFKTICQYFVTGIEGTVHVKYEDYPTWALTTCLDLSFNLGGNF